MYFVNYQDMIDELERLGLPSETFCLAPYITTDLDQDGSVLTCYRGKTRLGSWKEQPFEESFNGEKIKKIRSDLFQGIKNSNCRSCYNAEKNGSISPRMNFFADYMSNDLINEIVKNEKVGSVKNIVRSEIRPSSLCNQRCMHCGPHSSTKWIETLSDQNNFEIYAENDGLILNGLGPVDHKELNHKNMVSYYKSSITSETEYKDDILKLLDNSREVNFTGGEPLLTPEHIEYLNHFVNVSNSSKDKTLVYSTNLNIKNIEKYFQYWRKFKKVQLRVSIDSSFDTYNYFRTYGNIELVKENFRKIQKFQKECAGNDEASIKISASITFNMFSSLRWQQIAKDWKEYGLSFHASLIIDHPVSVKYMPKELSERALSEMQWCLDHVEDFFDDELEMKTYKHHTVNCMNYIKGFDNQFTEFPDFVVKYIEFCDKTSGNNVLDYYPELETYFE